MISFKEAKDCYRSKFEELESFVLNPTKYCQTVLIIKDRKEIEPNEFESYLPKPSIININLTLQTSKGEISQENLQKSISASEHVLYLSQKNLEIEKFLEKQMIFVAPNLT